MTSCLAPTRGLLRASRRYETVAVGHHTTPVDTDTPMAVTPDRTFDDVETPFAVFVPPTTPRTSASPRPPPLCWRRPACSIATAS